MSLSRVRTLIRLELTQRVRSVSWYVLLGVFAVVLLGVTALAFAAFSWTDERGAAVYSIVVFIVLLLSVLVSPTLSGNAINGDREAATLAPVQVTLATTAEILLGKFLAAWITGLAFVAVAVPFLLFAMIDGGVETGVLVVSLLVLIVEIGVISGIGVALSGILARPLFSVATTYLVVAALVIGTLIAFGLAGASVRSEAVYQYRPVVAERPWDPDDDSPALVCGEWQSSTYDVSRYDYFWWMLAPNPFAILADATPASFDRQGAPVDLFGQIKYGLRSTQLPPDLDERWDDCDPSSADREWSTPEETIAATAPSWFVGLGLQVASTAALLWWAWARTRTPARRLPPGTRVA